MAHQPRLLRSPQLLMGCRACGSNSFFDTSTSREQAPAAVLRSTGGASPVQATCESRRSTYHQEMNSSLCWGSPSRLERAHSQDKHRDAKMTSLHEAKKQENASMRPRSSPSSIPSPIGPVGENPASKAPLNSVSTYNGHQGLWNKHDDRESDRSRPT